MGNSLLIMLSLLLLSTMMLRGLECEKVQLLSSPNPRVIYDIWGDFHPNGVFYAVIEVGEPPRSFYLLHDTGSHLSWFQCPVPGAREGFHPPYETHNNFVPKSDPYCPSDSNSASNQLQVDKCECNVRYGDDSLFSGWLVRDKFLLRDMDMKTYQPSIVFGCGNLETDNVRESKSDGLLGLDRSELSVPSQLKHLGLTDNVHGHCLSRHGTGYGFFGGDFAQLPDDIVWLTMKPRNDDYTVESATLIIDGKPEKLGEVAFDSGTPYTYFNSRAYQAVYAMVKKSLRKSPLFPAKDDFLSHCWRGDKGFISVDEAKHYFEPITLHFPEENIIILQPEDYLVDSPSKNVCFGLKDGTSVKLGETNLIGDISMLDKLVIFDNERGLIGWASPANCKRRNAVDQDKGIVAGLANVTAIKHVRKTDIQLERIAKFIK